MEAKARAKVSVRALVVLALVAIFIYAADQITKYLVVLHLTEHQLVPVIGQLLQFQFEKNSGAAFSIGSSSTWIFSIIGIGVFAFVIWTAPRIRSIAWAVLFGLLLGGLLGNLSDRLFREPGFGVGQVIDFLRIPLLPAIFNLADSAIVTSMVMFLILTVMGIGLDGKRHAREAVSTGAGLESDPANTSDDGRENVADASGSAGTATDDVSNGPSADVPTLPAPPSRSDAA